MTISDRLNNEFNEQMECELSSAYLYLAMSAWCEEAKLEGAAHYLRIQAKEELEHAMKFFHHIAERGGKILLKPIGEPKETFSSLEDVFAKSLSHEQYITRRINNLMELSKQEKDYLAEQMLVWFVNEQLEEELSAERILDKLKLIGSSGAGLIMLDHQLLERK